MTETTDKWLIASDRSPKTLGWWPALWCYDPSEGSFPAGAFWDGEKWSIPAVSAWIDQPCKTKEEAEAVADENDPEW